jgi:CO/xanthine dehydrogenase Mo-binding subunit
VSAIGVSAPRRDSENKVRGRTRYAADTEVPGLLHARLVATTSIPSICWARPSPTKLMHG